MRSAYIVATFFALGASAALGQQTNSPVPAPTTDLAAPAAKLDETGPDLTPPQLLPLKRALMPVDACKEQHNGVVSLSLKVDVHGLPEDVVVKDPKGTSLEKLALLIVEEETFRPATLKGEAVTSRWSLDVSIEGCFAAKADAAGNSSDVFGLTAEPVQVFAKLPLLKETGPTQSVSDAGPGADGLYRTGHGISAPVPLNKIEAEFSEEARRKGVSGVCLIKLIVDAQGKPQNPRVVRSLGFGLDEKAIEAAMKYRFKPAMKAGVPVPVLITVQVNFSF